MHISHDSRPEGQGTKYDNTICYRKLQPSQTFTSHEGSRSGLCRKGLQRRRSVGNLHHEAIRKGYSQELDTGDKMTGKTE